MADRNKARMKAIRMSDEGEAKEKAWAEQRRADPRHRELRRQTALRWAKKNAKFAAGKKVLYEIIPGHKVRGTVLQNKQGRAMVQLKTSVEWISHRHLELATAEGNGE